METAVVFASRHGTTAEVAGLLATELGPGSVTCDLADGPPDLSRYDAIVFGTPVYAGKPRPELGRFLGQANLEGKRIGLFVCGMEVDPTKRAAEMSAAFPPDLAARATTIAFLGGRFRFDLMNAAERFIIGRIAKTKVNQDAIDRDAIVRFAQDFRE